MKVDKQLIRGRFAADAKVPCIALEDLGETVATVFGNKEKYCGKTLNLTGELLSGKELAGLFSELTLTPGYRYKEVNETYLRIFKPRFYRMRRYFELQGRLLESVKQEDQDGLYCFSGGLQNLLTTHIGKAISSAR